MVAALVAPEGQGAQWGPGHAHSMLASAPRRLARGQTLAVCVVEKPELAISISDMALGVCTHSGRAPLVKRLFVRPTSQIRGESNRPFLYRVALEGKKNAMKNDTRFDMAVPGTRVLRYLNMYLNF